MQEDEIEDVGQIAVTQDGDDQGENDEGEGQEEDGQDDEEVALPDNGKLIVF